MARESSRTLTVYPKREYELYEDGDYQARCLRIEEVQSTFADENGEYPWQYKFVWALLDEAGQPSDSWISGWCSQALGERAIYPKWYQAHTSRPADVVGEEVVVDDCAGRDVILTIGHKTKPKDGTVVNKVTGVRALAPPKAAPRRAGLGPRPTDDGQLGRPQAALQPDDREMERAQAEPESDPWETETI